MVRRLAVALSVAGLTAAAYGQSANVILNDKASQAALNLGGVAGIANTGNYMLETNKGATTVDDLLHMVKQSYYVSMGGVATDINSLSPTSTGAFDLNTDGNNEFATATYEVAGQYKATLTYRLTGGVVGSFAGTLSRSLTIQNLGASTQTFHLFDFADLNLTGLTSTLQSDGTYTELASPAPDKGSFLSATTAKQWDQWYSTPVTQAQVSVGQVPSRIEMTAGAATLRSNLETVAGYNLAYASGQAASLGAFGGNAGDDVALAFQWDVTLAPSARATISGATSIVPEPGSIALLAGGIGLLFGWRRRKVC